MHQDLSPGNVMCQVLTEAGTQIKVIKLVIIDFDLATRVDIVKGYTSPAHRTGTVPFMATDLIDDPHSPHYLRHDFESVFYIALWFITRLPRRVSKDDIFVTWDLVPLLKGSFWVQDRGWEEISKDHYTPTPTFQAYETWLHHIWEVFWNSKSAFGNHRRAKPSPSEPYDDVTCDGTLVYTILKEELDEVGILLCDKVDNLRLTSPEYCKI